MTSPMNLTEINQLIYAAASATVDTAGEKPRKQQKQKTTSLEGENWEGD